MKTLLLSVLSLLTITVYSQKIFSKFMIHNNPKIGTNVDSLITIITPAHPDSAKVPPKTKFYNVLVTYNGKIAAYKIAGKPWYVANTQNTMNSFMLSLLYYMQYADYYTTEELLEKRWLDKVEVFRKSDTTLIATFKGNPITYKIPRQP